ncbi:MAG: exodeoxyribonuclease VII large subunit, partial [Ginsengibacter sp.]
ILSRNAIIASAIGHADNITLFEKLSDKKFITPTQFGNYLKEIYNSTIEEFEQSKAKLTKDITTQLTANYGKQILNLNEQIIASKALYEKTIIESNKNHSGQLLNLTNQLKSFEDLAKKTTEEKTNLHLTEVTNLKKQIQDLTSMHQSQVTQINNLQAEQIKALNEQIQAIKNQQSQKDKLIEQANNLVSNYQQQLQLAQSNSKTN